MSTAIDGIEQVNDVGGGGGGTSVTQGTIPWVTLVNNVLSTGTITANGQTVSITPQAGASVLGIAVSGTWVGTFVIEGRINASDWTSIIPGGLGVSSLSFNITYQFAIGGFAEIRVRATAWTSGTANVTLITSIANTPKVYVENVGSITNPITVDTSVQHLNVEVQNSPNITTILNSVSIVVPEGDDETEGTTADLASGIDANGTVNAHLRQITKTLGTGITVTGGLTDAQLRASAVPVSAASLPLPTGAATEAGNLATILVRLTAILAQLDVALSTRAAESGGNLATIAAKDFATQTTLALIKAKTDNLDALLSSRTKPADQQHVVIDSSASIAVTGPLTDTQLRASSVPVSGPVTDTQIRATPLPVSGTVAVTNASLDGTTLATIDADIKANIVLKAGSAIIGKVGIDQTTPGTTNGVQVNAALPAGSAIIGKTGIDQTTPGTTNKVTVGSDVIHTVIDSSAAIAVTGPLTDTQLRATAVPVSGTVAISNAFNLEATQVLVKAKTDNLDVALSTRLKPADTLAAVTSVGTVTTVTGITNVVHVDDNGGSLTVDGTIAVSSAFGLEATQLLVKSDLDTVVTNTTGLSTAAAQTTAQSTLTEIDSDLDQLVGLQRVLIQLQVQQFLSMPIPNGFVPVEIPSFLAG